MAAQTIASEQYANNTKTLTESADVSVNGTTTAYSAAIKDLAEVSGDVTAVTVSDGKVTALTYSNTKTCSYSKADGAAGSYSVSE